MATQSVSSAVARDGVARGNRCLQHVWAARASERVCAAQRVQTATDQQSIPQHAVLIEQQDRLAGRR